MQVYEVQQKEHEELTVSLMEHRTLLEEQQRLITELSAYVGISWRNEDHLQILEILNACISIRTGT